MAVTQQELGRRIRLAREACGLTQESAAAQLGVSRPTFVQIEGGNRSVSSLELDRLAFVFGRDMREFVGDDFKEQDTLAVLFRAGNLIDGDSEVVEKLRECVAIGRELTNLERLIGVDHDVPAMALYPLTPPGKRWEAIKQGEWLAEEERRRLGLGSGPLPRVVDLLESQSVRTGVIDLPEDISGLTLHDRGFGLFVIANRRHHYLRRRFSFAHEYAHVVADRERFGLVSRSSERDNLVEVRANAFAASFLMPEEGVRQIVASFGKGQPSRTYSEVFDETGSVNVEARTDPGTQALQLYDVVQLAQHFRVSRLSALYRLRNLRLLDELEFTAFRKAERVGSGARVAELLGFTEPDHEALRSEFRHRFIALGLEAYRRDEISLSKLREIVAMVDVSREDLERVVADDGGESAPEDPLS